MAVKKRSKKSARDIVSAKRKVSKEEFTQAESIPKTSYVKKFKKSILIILVIIIISVVLAVLFYFKGLFIAAMVNGQPIARIALIQELERKDGKKVLSSLVTQTLILQEAQKKQVEINQKEVDEQITKIENSFKKRGQNLDQGLTAQGLTRKDFITQIRIQKLVEKMLAKDVKVTDKEVEDYVEKNKNNIPKDMKPEEVTSSARQQLEQQKLGEKFQPWLQKLQSSAKIQYFVNY